MHSGRVQNWRGRLRWAASQVPNRRARDESALVLGESELPGADWRVIDERSWRTGQSGDEGWAVRARESGLLTVWRSFEQADGDRWLWIQVTQLVSEVDAAEALTVVPDRLLSNARADVEVIAEASVEPPSIVGVSRSWAHESRTASRRGQGVALMLAYVLGPRLVTLAASGLTDSWSWAEVATIAEKQGQRLAETVE